MATAIWVIVVSVLLSILAVSILCYVLTRSYRKRRPLPTTEKDLEADHDRRSNTLINESPPPSSLDSTEKDVEADADHDRPPNSSPIDEEPPPALYTLKEAFQDLADYQRYFRSLRPSHAESSIFITTPSSTVVKSVPTNFSKLPGARPFFSFDTPPPDSPRTRAVIDLTGEEVRALGRNGSTTAHEPRGLQNAHLSRRNLVQTEGLQRARRELPRAPRRDIGPGNRLGGLDRASIEKLMTRQYPNGGLRRMSREVNLRGKMLAVS